MEKELMKSSPKKHNPKTRTRMAFLAFTITWAWLGLSLDTGAQEVKGLANKITQEQASEIALKVVPGKVTDIAIEKKRGRKVYVVEIVAEKGGVETDVLVDIESGKVLGTE
jgi:uncharacterized membrane protein YkoI